ncbi:MAG: Mu-like prophage major head subunit gpT family protein [Porphyromonadaceae bacterium]|nr:Mu-like prophage major head subunit gpT family protein [Porphyromonadaceae bacterium]
MGWVGPLSFESPSNSASERYAWLGQVPQMREWLGPRLAKELSEYDYTIINRKFESTLKVAIDDLNRDKTGQLQKRIAELAGRSNSHWAKLITELIASGTSSLCYDGKAFFANNHTEGDSGTQINLLTASQVPSLNVGTATAPTPAEMSSAIFDIIGYAMGYKDDQGEPLNEGAASWIVMAGNPTIYGAAAKAIASEMVVSGGAATDNILKNVGLNIQTVFNSRLVAADWTDKFVVFRADAPITPFIRQVEKSVQVQALAEGSDYEFNEDAHLYGLKAKRAAGYGLWQYAMHATLS